MGISKMHYRVKVKKHHSDRSWEYESKDVFVDPLRFGLVSEAGMIAATIGLDKELIVDFEEVG